MDLGRENQLGGEGRRRGRSRGGVEDDRRRIFIREVHYLVLVFFVVVV